MSQLIAVWDFEGTKEQLSFVEGEKIHMLTTDGAPPGWALGEIGDRKGYFPLNFTTEEEENTEPPDVVAEIESDATNPELTVSQLEELEKWKNRAQELESKIASFDSVKEQNEELQQQVKELSTKLRADLPRRTLDRVLSNSGSQQSPIMDLKRKQQQKQQANRSPKANRRVGLKLASPPALKVPPPKLNLRKSAGPGRRGSSSGFTDKQKLVGSIIMGAGPTKGPVNLNKSMRVGAKIVAKKTTKHIERGEEADYGTVYDFEEFDEDDYIFEKEKEGDEEVLTAGTLEKIIQMVTNPDKPDYEFMAAFFLTYHSFTNTRVLIEKFILRYQAVPARSLTDDELVAFETKKHAIKLRVINALRYWIEKHGFEFASDHGLAERMLSFINDPNTDKRTSDVLKRTMEKANAKYTDEIKLSELAERLEQIQLEQEKLVKEIADITARSAVNSTLKITIPKSVLPKGYREGIEVLLNWSPLEIARQLTLREIKIFKRIKPKEFVNQKWNKQNKTKLAPNLCAMIDSFNNTSKLLAASVLGMGNTQDRGKMLKQWISIAEACFTLHNFNTLMGIISGLSCAAIGRLHQSWSQVSTRKNERLRELKEVETNPEKNFRRMRDLILKSPPPKIPYIGIPLSDLTFVEDGNEDFVDSKSGKKLINFYKRHLLAKIIVECQTYQQSEYHFREIPMLQLLFNNIPILEEKEAYELSMKVEPRVDTNSPRPEKSRGSKRAFGKSTSTFRAKMGK